MLQVGYERFVGGWLMPFYDSRVRSRRTFGYWRECEANQWLPADEIAAMQWAKLKRLLAHAYDTSPYYREQFDLLEIKPEDIRSPADFQRLPLLDKSTIRGQRDRLISSAFPKSSLIASATGGSTGEPMQFYYDRDAYERRVGAAMRGDRWAGWRLCGGEFYVWGIPLIPEQPLRRLKVNLHHASLRRTIVNSYDLSEERLAAAVTTYNRLRPRVIVGYANAVYQFARYIGEHGHKVHRPLGVIITAEKSHEYQRLAINEVFGAPVFDRYGSREVMMIASECEAHTGRHVTADHLYVEIVRDGKPCAPGEPGEILLTDLHNYGMPFIRYRIGDVASWSAQTCPCGRGLPMLNVVEGRLLDIISTPDGRLIAGEVFPRIFRDAAGVRRYQVLQEEIDRIRIRVDVSAPLAASEQSRLVDTVDKVFGRGMRVEWEIAQGLEIEQGRKFRPVQSRIPAEFNPQATASVGRVRN